MKVVAYGIKSFEKKFLAVANQKKHDITLIANTCSEETCLFAEGKKAIILCSNHTLSAAIIQKLAQFGIRYILLLRASAVVIDTSAIVANDIQLFDLSAYAPAAIEEQIIDTAIETSKRILENEALRTIETLDNCENEQLKSLHGLR